MTEDFQIEGNKIYPDNFEDKTAFSVTSSSKESDKSSSVSEDSVSESEEPEDMNRERENETTFFSDEEKPLYQGSRISKILSCVLIVSFVLKHNLSKAAWTDLLRFAWRTMQTNISLGLQNETDHERILWLQGTNKDKLLC